MRIVSETSDIEIARQRAMPEVVRTLRELTANLIRITHGAGKPHEIGRQAQSFLAALFDYNETVGNFPPADEVARMLTIERDPDRVPTKDQARLEYHAEQAVIRGALQVAASRLLGQIPQEGHGRIEMYGDGINRIQEIREARLKNLPETRLSRLRATKRLTAKVRREMEKSKT